MVVWSWTMTSMSILELSQRGLSWLMKSDIQEGTALATSGNKSINQATPEPGSDCPSNTWLPRAWHSNIRVSWPTLDVVIQAVSEHDASNSIVAYYQLLDDLASCVLHAIQNLPGSRCFWLQGYFWLRFYWCSNWIWTSLCWAWLYAAAKLASNGACRYFLCPFSVMSVFGHWC